MKRLMRVAESVNSAAESMARFRRVRSSWKRSKRMRQPSVDDVSTAAVSLMKMFRWVSFSVGSLSSTVMLARSMPGEESERLPMVPCRRRSPMKSALLIFASFSSSASSTTVPFSRGHSLTSATARPMSAMVSLGIEGLTMRTPSMPRSSGKSRSTCSTLICMPVCSEAYCATRCATQFWMKGT